MILFQFLPLLDEVTSLYGFLAIYETGIFRNTKAPSTMENLHLSAHRLSLSSAFYAQTHKDSLSPIDFSAGWTW